MSHFVVRLTLTKRFYYVEWLPNNNVICDQGRSISGTDRESLIESLGSSRLRSAKRKIIQRFQRADPRRSTSELHHHSQNDPWHLTTRTFCRLHLGIQHKKFVEIKTKIVLYIVGWVRFVPNMILLFYLQTSCSFWFRVIVRSGLVAHCAKCASKKSEG